MDIIELGAIGELVGGVAVLVTLVYLARQVRQGNQLERAESQRAFIRDHAPAVFTPMMDRDMAGVIRRGSADFDSLSGDEQMMVAGWWAGITNLTETASQLREAALIDDDFANTIEQRTVSILLLPGANRWWNFAKAAQSDRFTRRMDELLNDPQRPPPFDQLLPWFGADDDGRT